MLTVDLFLFVRGEQYITVSFIVDDELGVISIFSNDFALREDIGADMPHDTDYTYPIRVLAVL